MAEPRLYQVFRGCRPSRRSASRAGPPTPLCGPNPGRAGDCSCVCNGHAREEIVTAAQHGRRSPSGDGVHSVGEELSGLRWLPVVLGGRAARMPWRWRRRVRRRPPPKQLGQTALMPSSDDFSSVYPLQVVYPTKKGLITVCCGAVQSRHSPEGAATPRPRRPAPCGLPAQAGPAAVRSQRRGRRAPR
jgi:hypothetical protein